MQSACAVLECHLWPVRIFHVFTHYLIRYDFQQEAIKHKMCSDFLRKFLLKFLNILTGIQRNINVHRVDHM